MELREFVHRTNLQLYKKQLAEETDEARRKQLSKLLTEEESQVVLAHKPKRIPPIRCDKCGGRAHLIRRTPNASKRDGSEIWTFECECGKQIQQKDKEIAGNAVGYFLPDLSG
jgi:hypothetical protein